MSVRPEQVHSRFETEVVLDATPADVWGTLEDMTTWCQWTDVFDVEARTPSPTWRPGHQFAVGPRLAGKRLWARVEIVECEPHRRLVWAGTLFGIPGRHGFAFEPFEGERCRMSHWESCGGVLGRLAVFSGVWRLLQGRFRRFNEDLQLRLAEDP